MYNLRPLHIWCQKVLPQVYDDSLSYYELLQRVLAALNMTIADVNELKEIVTGGIDVQEEVNKKIDEMVLDGTMDKIVARAIENDIMSPAGSGANYTSFDFTGLAAEMKELYNADLSAWNSTYVFSKWNELVNANSANMATGTAYTVDSVVAPYYLWKARRNRQTTHGGSSDENKFGTFAFNTYGEKTFIVTIGEMANERMTGVAFYTLFTKWLEGKYNGNYILDNYNFIIVPILNVLDWNSGSNNNYIRQKYKNGFTGYSDDLELNDAIETFMNTGIRNIMTAVMKQDAIYSYEQWRYNQKIVYFNLREISWGHDPSFEPLDGYTTGIIARGHFTRTRDAGEILYNSLMSTLRKIVTIKPEFYAHGAFQQLHAGYHSRHAITYCGAQQGYKAFNIELQKYVGDSYSDVSSVAYSENSWFFAFTLLYNVIMNSMPYLDKPTKRVYGDLQELGPFTYIPSINTSGQPVEPYRKCDVDDIIKKVPPGSYFSYAIRRLSYKDGDNQDQDLDMSLVYENLPSSLAGELHIRRGGNDLDDDASRGIAFYVPYYELSKIYYCKIYSNGTHSDWWGLSGLSAMEYCILRGDPDITDISTVADTVEYVELQKADWSSARYFGKSQGGIHVKKHGLYLVSGSVHISVDSGCTEITTFVNYSSDDDQNHSNAIAASSVPNSSSSFIGGVDISPRIVELRADSWIWLACRTKDDDGHIYRSGANTYLQALLVRELD